MPKPEGEPPFKFAAPVPTGIEFGANGPVTSFDVVGNDEGLKGLVADAVVASGNVVGETPMSRATRRTHGMPGVKGWNAKWQPEGPKNAPYKPTPPQDPRQN